MMKRMATMILLALTVFALAPLAAEAQNVVNPLSYYAAPAGAKLRAQCVNMPRQWGMTEAQARVSNPRWFEGSTWGPYALQVTANCSQAYVSNNPDIAGYQASLAGTWYYALGVDGPINQQWVYQFRDEASCQASLAANPYTVAKLGSVAGMKPGTCQQYPAFVAVEYPPVDACQMLRSGAHHTWPFDAAQSFIMAEGGRQLARCTTGARLWGW